MEGTKLTFYGYNDDNFAYDRNGKGCDEIDCYVEPAIFKVVDRDNPESGLFVVGQYSIGEGTPGCWVVGVMPLGEDVPLPENWKLTLGAKNYTATLTIESERELDVLAYRAIEDDEPKKEWRS